MRHQPDVDRSRTASRPIALGRGLQSAKRLSSREHRQVTCCYGRNSVSRIICGLAGKSYLYSNSSFFNA